MADYACPTCGAAVTRGSSSVAQHAGGVVGALLYAAFAGFSCTSCGKIEKSKFPPEVRAQMNRNSALLVVGAIVLLVVLVAILVAIN